jgi:aryl-alcohol dehydrogenase-like predicted oxidoreductase
MKYRLLGNSGLRVPEAVLGAMTFDVRRRRFFQSFRKEKNL